jgi:hypothetical protein
MQSLTLTSVTEANEWFFDWLVSSSSISKRDINHGVLSHILQSPSSPTLCTLSSPTIVLHPWSGVADHFRIDFGTFNRWWTSTDALLFRRKHLPFLRQLANIWQHAVTTTIAAKRRVSDATLKRSSSNEDGESTEVKGNESLPTLTDPLIYPWSSKQSYYK